MKKQNGFTLIELMIVVAIIGILASIALPAYQDYIARSQAAESVVLLDGAKVSIEIDVASDGTFPTDLAGLGIRITGKYGGLAVSAHNADSGTVQYTFSTSGVNAQIQGKIVEFVRTSGSTGVGVWTCNASNGQGGATLPSKLAPKGCN